ncbi:MAG: M23 family metallopeptidase [Anaerolineales bacterium]
MLLAALLWGLAVSPSRAAGPDYAAVGLFALPWACGEGHVITWDPQGHWEANKASGVAYDLRMAVGTPLYAPTDGVAHFLVDDRPFETNLGNYVDLVTLDGNWLIRLAHLDGVQAGQRQVRAGDLIGHSGDSGATAAHLHLELLVRSGSAWVPPDLSRLTRLFGLPRSAFVEGATLTNDTCATTLVVAGDVVSLDADAPLGQAQRLQLALRNDSLNDVPLDWVQLSVYSTQGLAQVVDREGSWRVAARDTLTIEIPALLGAEGDWYVGRVVVRSAGSVSGQPATGQLRVGGSALQVRALSPGRALYAVGEVPQIKVVLQNQGTSTWQAQDVIVEGSQPHGDRWEASLGAAVTLAGGQSRRLVLTGAMIPRQVGAWRVERVAFVREGHRFVLATSDLEFGVQGLQLDLEQVDAEAVGGQVVIRATLRNVGTAVTAPDRIEAWGWQPDGVTTFTASTTLPALFPGQSTLVRMTAPLNSPSDGWRLADVGYWLKGTYYSAGMPRYGGGE